MHRSRCPRQSKYHNVWPPFRGLGKEPSDSCPDGSRENRKVHTFWWLEGKTAVYKIIYRAVDEKPEIACKCLKRLVGANGFEPSTSWSRTSLDQTKSVELTAFACAFPPLIRATWATKYRWPQSRPTCLGALLPGIFPQIACPSYLISEVKRFHRHLATVT